MTKAEEFILSHVLGKRVMRICPMTPDESNAEGWVHNPEAMVLELDNGVKLYPAQTLGYTPIYGELNDKRFKI